MKEAGILAVITMFIIGFAIAAAGGGKVRGEKGQGYVADGIQAQGQASMPRVGR